MTSGAVQCWGSNVGGGLHDGGLIWSRESQPVVGFDGAPSVPGLGTVWSTLLAATLFGVGRRRLR
jgi:hypothetical protein